MIINQPEDLIFYPALVQQTADLIAIDGTPVQRVEIAGTRGHLDGVLSLAQVGDVIEALAAAALSSNLGDQAAIARPRGQAAGRRRRATPPSPHPWSDALFWCRADPTSR